MKEAIQAYIEAYNSKNVEAMLALVDDEVIFENVSNSSGIITTKTKQDFEKLASQSLGYFIERKQVVRFSVMSVISAAVEIDYRAVLAQDLPNGMRAGQELQLRGVSIFEMKRGKFTRISDYS